MTLFVDWREDRKSHSAEPLTPYLHRHLTPTSLVDNSTELHSGDVCHHAHLPGGRVGNVGYEIKHVSDALQCMETGRLAGVDGQLERMQHDYDVRWVVIEDDLRPDPDSGVLMKKLTGGIRLVSDKRRGRKRSNATNTRGSLEEGRWVPAMYGGSRHVLYSTLVKFLTISCFEHHAMLWRTGSRDETAQFLAAEYRMWTDKEYERHKSVKTFNSSSSNGRRPLFLPADVKVKADMIARFDGIGYEKGVAIARASEGMSPREMMEWLSVKELVKIAGIGKVLAGRLVEQVDRKGKGRGK